MATIDVNGIPVRYADTGGPGPAVLFSHGFLMDHTMFRPQVGLLGGTYRCIRWDEPGFGGTPAPGPFDYWDLADLAVGLMDRLDVSEATLVGMSQGGYLSLRAALAHPERVRALVLIDTEAGVDDEETREGYRQMFASWMDAGPSEELLNRLAGMILGQDEPLRSEWKDRWRELDPVALRHPVACLLERDDITDRISEIEAPALVIHGEEDPAISLEKAEEMHSRLPNAEEIVPVAGAAHAPNLTHPEMVNPVLEEFLERHG